LLNIEAIWQYIIAAILKTIWTGKKKYCNNTYNYKKSRPRYYCTSAICKNSVTNKSFIFNSYQKYYFCSFWYFIVLYFTRRKLSFLEFYAK